MLAARALDLTLTTRDKGRDDAVPMCGVHAPRSRGTSRASPSSGTRSSSVSRSRPQAGQGDRPARVVRVVDPRGRPTRTCSTPAPPATSRRSRSARAGRGGGGSTSPRGSFAPRSSRGSGARRRDRPGRAARGPLPAGEDEVRIRRLAPARGPDRDRALRGRRSAPPARRARPSRGDAARGPRCRRCPRLRARHPAARHGPGGPLAVYRPEDTIVLDETTKTNLEITETLMERKRHGR